MRHITLMLVLLASLIAATDARAQLAGAWPVHLDQGSMAAYDYDVTDGTNDIDLTAKSSVAVVVKNGADITSTTLRRYDCDDAEMTCSDGNFTLVTPVDSLACTSYCWQELQVTEPGESSYRVWLKGPLQIHPFGIAGSAVQTGTLTVTSGAATLTTGAAVQASSVADDGVTPDAILSTGQTDEYCLTYEATGDTFEWQTCGSGGGGTDDQTIDVFTYNAGIISLSLESDGEATKTIDISSIDTDTQLSEEQVEDFAGGMVTGGTETLITVTYDDANGRFNFVVDNDLSQYDNTTSNFSTGAHTTDTDDQTIDVLSFDGTNISISLADDGQATQTLDISSVSTDDQTAAEVTSSATGNIVATNVDAAIAELEAEKQPLDTDLTDLADGSLTGTKVGFADTNGDYAATDVQTAIEELASVNGSGVNSATAKVDWSQLGNVPAGFADGSDDGSGGSGDEISVEESGTTTAAANPVFADSTQINFGLNAAPTLDRIFATIVDGSVTNANLANSTVSYGGVSQSLGGSDATPAFDLQDATGYPALQLTGTLANLNTALGSTIADGAHFSPSTIASDYSITPGNATFEYNQTDAEEGAPSAGDCNATGEYGRFTVDTDEAGLYFCHPDGWTLINVSEIGTFDLTANYAPTGQWNFANATMRLPQVTSTTDGFIAFDSVTDRIEVGDGTSALQFYPGAHTTSASDLTSGTLPDAQLPAEVPLTDEANTFSVEQTFSDSLIAGVGIRFAVTGTDPILSASNGVLNVSSGALQVGGSAVFTAADGALDDDDVTAADVGLASPSLDDTDASVEWEDAADLDADGSVSDNVALGGNPTATTPAVGDDDTSIATTAFVHNEPLYIQFALSDATTDLTTGSNVTGATRAFESVTIDSVWIWVDTAPTGSAIIVDVNDDGTSIFSTAVQIDAGDKESVNSGTAAVIANANVTELSELTFDIDQIGSSTAGAGLKILLFARKQ